MKRVPRDRVRSESIHSGGVGEYPTRETLPFESPRSRAGW